MWAVQEKKIAGNMMCVICMQLNSDQFDISMISSCLVYVHQRVEITWVWEKRNRFPNAFVAPAEEEAKTEHGEHFEFKKGKQSL